MSYTRELDALKRISRAAGDIILSYYDQDYEIELKGDDSPVTVADKAASDFIIEELKKVFPEDAILSEECIPETSLKGFERVWVIDPMDGTQEFIKKNGEFAVMIGLAVKHEPVVGIVFQPVTGYMYWAAKGEGAFYERDGEIGSLKTSQVKDLPKVRIAASRSHLSRELMGFYKEMGLTQIKQSGSVGLKIAMIAVQSCDLYMSLSNFTGCWDTCAPQIILQEAGGVMTNISGEPLKYDFEELKNLSGIIASNTPLHPLILSKLESKLHDHYTSEVEELEAEQDDDEDDGLI